MTIITKRAADMKTPSPNSTNDFRFTIAPATPSD